MVMAAMMVMMPVIVNHHIFNPISPPCAFPPTIMPEGDEGMPKPLEHEEGQKSLSWHPCSPLLRAVDGYSCGLSVDLLRFIFDED